MLNFTNCVLVNRIQVARLEHALAVLVIWPRAFVVVSVLLAVFDIGIDDHA